MLAAAAADLALSSERLAMAISWVCAALANAGSSRLLILATPRIPQRSFFSMRRLFSTCTKRGQDSSLPVVNPYLLQPVQESCPLFVQAQPNGTIQQSA